MLLRSSSYLRTRVIISLVALFSATTLLNGLTKPGQFARVPARDSSANLFQGFYGVAAISVDDAWAVGYTWDVISGGGYSTLAAHWDGTSWTQVSGPVLTQTCASTYTVLRDIAAISSTDIWAAGETCAYPNAQTLAEHWDGTSWTQIPTPNPGGRSGCAAFYGLTAISTDDVWAVGEFGTNCETSAIKAFSEHWDGTTWKVVPTPNPATATGSELLGVAGSGPDDVWAVGDYEQKSFPWPSLIEHWNGTKWSIVRSPSFSSTFNNVLWGAAALSSNEAWAVGQALDEWNGSKWTGAPPASSNDTLQRARAFSSTDVWAAGADYLGNGSNTSLIEHYDGTSWSVVQPAQLTCDNGRDDYLNGVGGSSPDDVWAVGECSNVSLIEHWDGISWSAVPSP